MFYWLSWKPVTLIKISIQDLCLTTAIDIHLVLTVNKENNFTPVLTDGLHGFPLLIDKTKSIYLMYCEQNCHYAVCLEYIYDAIFSQLRHLSAVGMLTAASQGIHGWITCVK